jgi:hypothetical protein
MATKCPKSESGEHEPDFEGLRYAYMTSANTALFLTACFHCDATAEFTVNTGNATWIEEHSNATQS